MTANARSTMSSSLVLQSARELQYSSGDGLLHAEWSPAALKWEPKTCKAVNVPHLDSGLATKPPARPVEPGGGKGQGRCRVEGCNALLADEKVYYRVRLGLLRRLWRDGEASPVYTIPSDTLTVLRYRSGPFAEVPHLPLPRLAGLHHHRGPRMSVVPTGGP